MDIRGDVDVLESNSELSYGVVEVKRVDHRLLDTGSVCG